MNRHYRTFRNWAEQKKIQQALNYLIAFGAGMFVVALIMLRGQLSIIAGTTERKLLGITPTPKQTVTIPTIPSSTPSTTPQPTSTPTLEQPQYIPQQYQQPTYAPTVYIAPTTMPSLPPQKVPVYTTGAGLITCDPIGADAVKSADQVLSQAQQQMSTCDQQGTQSEISCNHSCIGQPDMNSCYNSCNSVYQSGTAVCQAIYTGAQSKFSDVKNKYCP